MDHYYVNQTDYFELVEIRNCIVSGKLDEAITKLGSVDPNGYVRGTKRGSWVPILYFSCLSDKNDIVVKFLIKNGADPKRRPDDGDRPEPLIFHCHAIYLQYLVQKGCSYYRNVNIDIVKRLHCGDHKRLISLVRLGVLTESQIREALDKDDTICTCLKTLVKYIIYVYNNNNEKIQKGQYNIKEETDKVIKQYQATCLYITSFNNGYITDDSISYAVSHYLYEFLIMFKDKIGSAFPKQLDVKYHTTMDLLTVAITRPLLNDGRYYRTCEFAGVRPCEELTASIYT
jgi:hypothetical protein